MIRAKCARDLQTLRRAALTLPVPNWPEPTDWNLSQYREPVDFAALADEIRALAKVLTACGTEVLLHEPAPQPDQLPRYNGIFVRDQFLLTPEGAIVGRMGSVPRAGEEREATSLLATAGVPILASIRGEGCFEGADALWLNPGLVMIGVGNRTNRAGVRQVKAVLSGLGVRTVVVPMPGSVQHLLGLVQVVARDHVIVRAAYAAPPLLAALAQAGMSCTGLRESAEITERMAMNVVIVAEGEVVMPAGCPQTRRLLEDAGLRIRAEADCRQLARAAGGLACATGILARASVAA